MSVLPLLVFSAVTFHCVLAGPVVRTSQGYVEGTVLKSKYGKDFYAFRGIPYAEPPIGSLRFRDPVPKTPWSGTLSAQEAGQPCVQMSGNDVIGSEDCLFLNVYTPSLEKNASLSVMIFIHGGSFLNGNGGGMQPGYLLDKDIILMTLNYRLGILGFLSTGDMEAPGNFALKDQLLVLKWAKLNVRAFGGNPEDVTLVGQSAGSVCAHLLSLSKKSKEYFHRYILQSGLATYIWGFRDNSTYYKYPAKVGKLFDCPTDNSNALVQCLRQLNASDLVKTSKSVFTIVQQFGTLTWGPTIEPNSSSALVTEDPVVLIQKNQMKKSPLVLGNCRNEGLLGTENLYANELLYQVFRLYPDNVISEALSFSEPLRHKNLTALTIKVKNFYFGEEMPEEKDKVIQGYTDFATDFIFFYPQVQYIRYLLKNFVEPFYAYLFNYRGRLSTTSHVIGDNRNIGINHGDDVIYLFPQNLTLWGLPSDTNQTSSDSYITDVMVDLWTSFVMTSEPVSNLLSEPTMWKPYASYKTYLEIGNITEPLVTEQRSFFTERIQFIDELYNDS